MIINTFLMFRTFRLKWLSELSDSSGYRNVPITLASNDPEYPFGIFRVACWGFPKPQAVRLRVRPNTPFGVALRSLRSLPPAHPRRRGRRKMRCQEVYEIDRKLYFSESFPVSFFVMVRCPCWHFTVILSPTENPACSSHFPCKTICVGACL